MSLKIHFLDSYLDFFQQTWVLLIISMGNIFMDYQGGDVITGQVESQYDG